LGCDIRRTSSSMALSGCVPIFPVVAPIFFFASHPPSSSHLFSMVYAPAQMWRSHSGLSNSYDLSQHCYLLFTEEFSKSNPPWPPARQKDPRTSSYF
jgi:hypothetical protein